MNYFYKIAGSQVLLDKICQVFGDSSFTTALLEAQEPQDVAISLFTWQQK